MKERIVLIGCVGTAKNIIEHILDAELNFKGNIHLEGICIDSYPRGSKIMGVPILAGTNDISTLLKETDYKFLFALYKPDKMSERLNLLKSFNIPANRWINFIHPKAWIAESVKFGYGNIVLSNVSIMSDVILGNFNIINPGVTIEHGTSIYEGNFIAAGSIIGADVNIESSSFIGLNSAIRECVKLNRVYSGMGSLILEDFERAIIYGQPARIRKSWE